MKRAVSLSFALLLPGIALAQTTVMFEHAGKPLAEYRYAEVPFKPYIAQLYSPSGVPVLRDSPSDHKHHHALMFAIGADGVDFWSETPQCGRQVEFDLKSGKTELTEYLDWTAPDNRLVLREKRTIRIHTGEPATLLTWRSRFETPPGRDEIKLTGSHYFGFGMRFVIPMDKGGTFLHAAGQPGDVVRGDERLTASKWSAYSAAADGKQVTAAIFDHPSNLRYPARMFTMNTPFAYLSATLNLWKEPYVLKAGQPLDLRYGVALWDGTADVKEIESLYERWLKLVAK